MWGWDRWCQRIARRVPSLSPASPGRALVLARRIERLARPGLALDPTREHQGPAVEGVAVEGGAHDGARAVEVPLLEVEPGQGGAGEGIVRHGGKIVASTFGVTAARVRAMSASICRSREGTSSKRASSRRRSTKATSTRAP